MDFYMIHGSVPIKSAVGKAYVCVGANKILGKLDNSFRKK
jgi:hypothetical protein